MRLGSELLSIPCRTYYDPPVPGFVRQKHLARIVRSQNAWNPCFAVPSLGDYVVEIVRVVQENLTDLETSIYADLVRANPEFPDIPNSVSSVTGTVTTAQSGRKSILVF